MITEGYVSFETAKLLKEKGFNEFCRAFRSPSGNLFYSSHDVKNFEDGKTIGGAVAAPTLQMAMKWLREIHHIHIEVSLYSSDEDGKPLFYPCAYDTIRCNQIGLGCYDSFQRLSYEEAVEVALNWCLENLIK